MEEATRNAFGKAILEFSKDHPEIVTIDADLSGSTKTQDFAKENPNKAFNVGIAEQDLIGTAAGLALSGKRPFACSFAVFATGRAWEQIRNTVCVSHLPVVVVGSHAGILTGEDGETHQALEDVAIMRVLPHMNVYSPADSTETRAIVKYILEHEKGPCYLRLGREKVPVIFNKDENFDFPKVRQLTDGNDLVIFATGSVVGQALMAANKIKEDGVNASVVNVSCLKPVDRDGIINQLKKSSKCVSCEDHSVIGGLGSIVSDIIAEEGIDSRILKIGMHGFGESGTPYDLYAKYGLDAEGIYEKIKQFLK
ncbi:MAG: transketolase family protein [Candidatus Gracilibacteria bacterium]|jgi:transketolase|nr:transketolase family protein [Candidatus Gracilibacteria bacterium]